MRKYFFPESGEAVAQAAQGGGGVTIPGGAQETRGYGTEGRGQWAWWGWADGGARWSQWSFPTSAILWFCDYTKNSQIAEPLKCMQD